MAKVYDQVISFREDSRSTADIVENLKDHGWEEAGQHPHAIEMTHPQIPGHTKMVIRDDK